jgi:hypothetical protein
LNMNNGRTGAPNLHSSAIAGSIQGVTDALDAGINIDTISADDYRNTALQLAVEHDRGGSHVDVVKLLIERRANLDARDSVGQTALHTAAHQRFNHLAHLLIDAGASRTIRTTNRGETPAEYARRLGHEFKTGGRTPEERERGQVYLDTAADLTGYAISIHQQLFEAATGRDHLGILSLLEQRADPNLVMAYDGGNAFHRAATSGDVLSIAILLENGADRAERTQTPDMPRRTAGDMARPGIAEFIHHWQREQDPRLSYSAVLRNQIQAQNALRNQIQELQEELVAPLLLPAVALPAVEIEGLEYQQIPGDGHCLFNAVAIHLAEDQQTLRNRVADYLLNHIEDFRVWIEGVRPQNLTMEGYIESIRHEEWADHLEIHILNQVLNCQIIIFTQDGRIREGQDINFNIPYQRTPIFVLYNGHNHYDGLLLREGYSRENILDRLRPLRPSVLQPELMGGGDYHCMPLIPTFLGFSDRSDLERGFQEDLKRNVEMRQKLEWDRKVVEGCSWGAILIMASLQSILSKTGNLPEDAVLALGLIQLLLTLTIASARGFSKYRAERIDGAIDASIHLGAHRNYFLREAPRERPPEIENSEDVLRKRFIS